MRFILPFLLLLLLSSCHSPSIERRLDLIERQIESNPIQAQVALDSLNEQKPVFITNREKARLLLLNTYCGYKNYKNETNDSLISIAEEYFRAHGPEHEKMLSLFLHGFILHNNQEFREAMWKYKEAAETAEGSGDHFMCGKIYTHLYVLCSDAYDAYDINYAQRALEEYQLYGDEGYILDGEINVAYAYSGHNEYESANVYLTRALEIAQERKDTFAISKCYQRKSYIELQKGNPEGAKRYYQKLFSSHGASHYLEDYSALAIIHAQLNQPDSALYYLNKVKTMSHNWEANRLRFLHCGVQVYECMQDYQHAFEYESQYQQLRDSIYWKRLSNSVMRENHDFVVGQLEKTEHRLYHILGIAVMLVLFLTILSGYIVLYRRQQYYAQLFNQEKIDHLNEVIKLQAERSQYAMRVLKQSEVVGRFRLALEDQYHINDQDWKELNDLFTEYLPNFEGKLRNNGTPLNESEWQICMLQKLDFTNNEIAALTCRVKNSISMTSKRLYERYTLKEGGSKEWHDFLETL